MVSGEWGDFCSRGIEETHGEEDFCHHRAGFVTVTNSYIDSYRFRHDHDRKQAEMQAQQRSDRAAAIVQAQKRLEQQIAKEEFARQGEELERLKQEYFFVFSAEFSMVHWYFP
mgnify:CR=1 FL=1